MSIEICILASGSGGNCTVVRTPSGVLLIDAGLGPLSAGRRMEGSGIHVREISAICLTHLDHDHFGADLGEDAAAAANSGLLPCVARR